MAAFDVNSAIANVKTMLAALTTWQLICGVTSAAEATKRIYRYAVADRASETLCPCIILDLTQQSQPIEFNKSTLITIEVHFQLEVPRSERATLEDEAVWMWTTLSLIQAEIQTVINQTGSLMCQGTVPMANPNRINPDENGARHEWAFTLGLSLRVV